MDYLDPKKEHAQMVRLLTGYFLIGIAVLFATLILLYQAYGFGLNKTGQVIQNGLVFVSSVPSPARLYLDGNLNNANTNTKLQIPAGQYTLSLQRDGYKTWQRIISVDGGSVQHFDYPKLFPAKITTSTLKSYMDIPGLATQSPDRRWLIVQAAASPLEFDLYDLSNPKKVSTTMTSFNIPDSIVTNPKTGTHSWKLVEWSSDNRHVLLQHISTMAAAAAEPNTSSSTSEYILLDRQTPAGSLNLTKSLSLTNAKQLSLTDKKYDKYYVYDPETKALGTTSLDAAAKITPFLDQVLAYKSYGASTMLYITDRDPITDKATAAGTVLTVLRDSSQTYRIRDIGTSTPYLIDLVQYSGDWYIAAGASGDNKVYIYKNPQAARRDSVTTALVPIQILHVISPTKLAFSSNSELVMIENGTTFADYDIETNKGYNFVSHDQVDLPTAAAAWMGDHRLSYVSGGKLMVFDYDNINAYKIAVASPNYAPFFDPNYATLYTLAASTTAAGPTAWLLTDTSLRTPVDQ